jgi:hypothetical protein
MSLSLFRLGFFFGVVLMGAFPALSFSNAKTILVIVAVIGDGVIGFKRKPSMTGM